MDFEAYFPLAVFSVFAIALAAASSRIAYLALSSIARRSPSVLIIIPAAGILLALIGGHRAYLERIPDAISSTSWPTTTADIARVHLIDLPTPRGRGDLGELDMPYTYTVNGRNYTGMRFYVTGNRTGKYSELDSFARSANNTVEIHYNPKSPTQSVVVSGFAPFRINPFSILPTIFFGLLLGYGILRARGVTPSSRPRLLKAYSVPVGIAALIWFADTGLLFVNFYQPHGTARGYKVLESSAMDDGVTYAIAVDVYWRPWDEGMQTDPPWLTDARDQRFIAQDGSLKDIVGRKWLIYEASQYYEMNRVPSGANPDWIMTWTADAGIHTEANSVKAKAHLDEMKKYKEHQRNDRVAE